MAEWNGLQSRTSHGVGYILNVHEAPNGISWQMRNKKNMYAVFEGRSYNIK